MGHTMLAASSGKYLVFLSESIASQCHVLFIDVCLCSCYTDFSYWNDFLKESD